MGSRNGGRVPSTCRGVWPGGRVSEGERAGLHVRFEFVVRRLAGWGVKGSALKSGSGLRSSPFEDAVRNFASGLIVVFGVFRC